MRISVLITSCLLMALMAAPAAGQGDKRLMAVSSSDAPPWAKGSADSKCLETTKTGCIDWSRGYAIGVGFGQGPNRMMAERIAQLIAQRNLLEIIKGVNLNSSTTVKNSALESDIIRTQISGRLQGLVPVDKTRFYSDGSIGVKYKASLFAMVPEKAYRAKRDEPKELEVPQAPAAGSALNSGAAYTGLIIDARGTGVRPAMSPKVFDPRGREVYGSAYVSREFATSQGMMGYVKSIRAARGTDRVKGNPALIKALEAKGANKADLVISQADADALRAMSKQQTFLKESRVMVVLD
ncbi:MAG: hypothetical protein V3S64_10090 [bacterium]